MKYLPLFILLLFAACVDHTKPAPGTKPPIVVNDTTRALPASTLAPTNGYWTCSTKHPEGLTSFERSSQPPSPLDGVMARTKLWSNGYTIRVGFIGGTQIEWDSVKRACALLSTYANINFSFPSAPPYDERVSFENNGAWAVIGKDALLYTSGATINLARWALTQPGAYVHELQHALGGLHEQQHPQGPKYDTLKTLAYYRAWQGWSDPQIYWNVLTRHNTVDNTITPYDRISNLHYPTPPEITKDGVGSPGGRALTGGDINILKLAYAGRGTPPTDPPGPTGTNVTLTAAQAQALYAQVLSALTAANTGKGAATINFGQAQNMVSLAQTNLNQSQINLNAAEATRVKAEAAVAAAKTALKIQ